VIRIFLSKMEDFPLSFVDSQINLSFISYLSSFINEMCERDYTDNLQLIRFSHSWWVNLMGSRDCFWS